MNKVPSKGAAAFLAIFFGTLGVHHFYLKRNNIGVVWLILAIIFSWTLFVPFCLGVMGFFQGLSYLFYNKENWEKQFKL